jgi:hypothetical protein
MLIKKEQLRTLWYEDENGKRLDNIDENEYRPKGAKYQVSQFPLQLVTTHLELVSQENVDKCKHPRKYIKPTYGWIDGIVGRECKLCHGTQVKKKWHLWGRKWEGYGSRELFPASSGWSEDLALTLVTSGDYTLSEAIIISARSCERCMNALAHKYGLDWGYAEGSEEWKRCGTECDFCKE